MLLTATVAPQPVDRRGRPGGRLEPAGLAAPRLHHGPSQVLDAVLDPGEGVTLGRPLRPPFRRLADLRVGFENVRRYVLVVRLSLDKGAVAGQMVDQVEKPPPTP